MMRRLFAGLALALALVAGPAGHAAAAFGERILSFTSDVVVATDGSLTVTETIEVNVAGVEIRHGIYRDFPTLYRGPWGLHDRVGFKVLEVRRDGAPEPWSIANLDNGVRVYIGDPDRLVSDGLHTYTLVYRTDRQIAFLDGTDELAWNVTGNGWAFPIDKVEATIHLPDGARPLQWAAYTGRAGATGHDATIGRDGDHAIRATTTRGLKPREGLTVAVSWQAGIVARPSALQRVSRAVIDNLGFVIAVLALLCTLAYFIQAWAKVGRDPAKGTIIPLYEAPDHLSPVATGYVFSGGFRGDIDENDAFAVAITSLATKGYLKIDQDGDSFTVTRLKPAASDLPVGEATIMTGLLAADSVTLDGTYKPAVRTAVSDLVTGVKTEYGGVYRKNNTGIWLGGSALAAIGAVLALFAEARTVDAMVLAIFLSLFAAAFGAAVVFLLRMAFAQLAAGLHGKVKGFVTGLAGIAFAIPFMFPVGFVMFQLNELASGPVIAIIVVLAILTAVFQVLMKAPTRAGRALLDRIEGYRLYLSVAESDRMTVLSHEPELTPELFERHLPYAMALGVADAWAVRFAAMAGREGREWSPGWYQAGGGRVGGVQGLAGAVHALGPGLGGTISSSARAPSRSSGGSSGGGGFSGGGGGGGGGGGW